MSDLCQTNEAILGQKLLNHFDTTIKNQICCLLVSVINVVKQSVYTSLACSNKASVVFLSKCGIKTTDLCCYFLHF